MNRKLTIIAVIVISLFSIAIVAFFGVVPQAEPKEIPVKEVMFVDRKGGTEEHKVKTDSDFIDFKGDTMYLYYYITPATATDKEVKVTVNTYGVSSNITVDKVDDGVLLLDYHGTIFQSDDMFTVTITQIRDGKVAEHDYIFN